MTATVHSLADFKEKKRQTAMAKAVVMQLLEDDIVYVDTIHPDWPPIDYSLPCDCEPYHVTVNAPAASPEASLPLFDGFLDPGRNT